ncbi:putative annexin A5, partial [Triplophysa rosa]
MDYLIHQSASSEGLFKNCSSRTATDALTKEVPGGIHLFASCSGMGVESKCVFWGAWPTVTYFFQSLSARATSQIKPTGDRIYYCNR